MGETMKKLIPFLLILCSCNIPQFPQIVPSADPAHFRLMFADSTFSPEYVFTNGSQMGKVRGDILENSKLLSEVTVIQDSMRLDWNPARREINKLKAQNANLLQRIVELEIVDSTYTFTWNRNPEPDVHHYTLKIDTLQFTTTDTFITVDLRKIVTVTATDISGNESGKSNIVRVK